MGQVTTCQTLRFSETAGLSGGLRAIRYMEWASVSMGLGCWAKVRFPSMKQRTFLCKSHPDFHVPADVVVGEGFDGEAYCRRVKEAGADAVAFFGKCHYGHCYYHTDFGNRHPQLRKDMLAEVCRGAKKVGLGVVGYYSVFLDTLAITQHPDWRVQAENTRTDAGFDSGNFLPVCVNSPYLEELLIPQSVEMATRYEIDELLFDTMTGFRICYCDNCRRKFGKEIPADSSHPNWGEYVQWYAHCYESFYARSAEAIHQANPKVAVIYNWEWVYTRPKPPVKHIGRLCADLISTGTIASMQCRFMAGSGLPFDYMTGRFMHGLGEWNSNTPESLLYTGAATVGNGASFYIIDRQLPDGQLEDRAYDMMKTVFGYFQERRPWLEGTSSVPEMAVLYSWSSVMGPNLEFYPDGKTRTERTLPFSGVTRLMIEHGRHFTAMTEERLCEVAGEYRVIIVPEQEYLAATTKQRLRSFVESGGKLIITHSAWNAPADPDMLAMAGVCFDGKRELNYGYVDLQQPLLLREQFAKVTPLPATQTLHRYVPPMCGGQGSKKFGHGYAPPTAASNEPVVTSRRLGKGEVIYIAHPFFKAYHDHQNPTQARMLLALLDRVLPDPVATIATPAQVELCTMRKGDDLIVHLVNHSGRERLGNYWYPVTEYIPEIRDIALTIRGSVQQAKLAPSGESLTITHKNGRATMTVPSLHVMQTVHIPGYFNNGDR